MAFLSLSDTGVLAGSHATTLAGESVHLLAQHALWWPARATLCIADLHLGKAATFRARGIPVPAGTTEGNLERLSALLLGLPVRRLVVLGDFLHAAQARTPAVLAALAAWRERHPAVELVLVRGNHDSHAGDPPPALGMAVVDEPWPLGPFAACHHPQVGVPLHVLAGHVHPAVVLRGPGRDALRLPCFAVHPQFTLLPAFGLFTGMASLAPEAGCQLFAVGGERVWPVPHIPARTS
ncbi:metallophosphoesterase, DNA ligase-associated [Delftia tsuruhatensis]|uniref:ligase-associated DNA damage response endonuclease PdeM n=1 Tax=Delftia tsuruhatensis TaxID=180282 RepID=UPI001E7EF2AA|nr:ligase-associated DNA damage response endonuclease PdeM [Delftia tsuruhatensis]CAB5717532.1 metallophosphoesterase, DNA ligase-associated [Delftia tsuruhatensis]CAC9686313.1 metallophosphoesterase, DNA ligase-associated [Delftia tsuruhatensis]